MKTAFLQFELLSELATFSKTVSNRGYVIVIKDLTLQCRLSDRELETALHQFNAKLLALNKAAA